MAFHWPDVYSASVPVETGSSAGGISSPSGTQTLPPLVASHRLVTSFRCAGRATSGFRLAGSSQALVGWRKLCGWQTPSEVSGGVGVASWEHGLSLCGGPMASLRPGLQPWAAAGPGPDEALGAASVPMLTLDSQPRARSCCEQHLTAVKFFFFCSSSVLGRRRCCNPIGPGLPASFENFASKVHS